jgi:hypothetical protein
MTTKKAGVPARTLLLTTSDGEVRITIPAGSRVTFGPSVPFARKDDSYGARVPDYSLRVYETAKNDSLVAVFSGVRSFRDINIPHDKLVVREAGKSIWKSDEKGYKVKEQVERTQAWEKFVQPQLEPGE